MDEPIIRKRVRFDPDAPPPTPDEPWRSKWPPGSECFASGGAGKVTRSHGWVFRKGGEYVAYHRTGPGNDDVVFVGRDKDFYAALMLICKKPLWPETNGPSAGARAPSPPKPAAPGPQVRQRVRTPARG